MRGFDDDDEPDIHEEEYDEFNHFALQEVDYRTAFLETWLFESIDLDVK